MPKTSSNQSLARFLKELESLYIPHLSVNIAVFGFFNGQLQVLLQPVLPDKLWALQGVFVKKSESLDQAASRALLEATGTLKAPLRQFHTFGAIDRIASGIHEGFESLGIKPPKGHWVTDRVVSIGYYSVLDIRKARPATNLFGGQLAWHPVTSLPALIMDHERIIVKALESVCTQIDTLPLGGTLLPLTFSMRELQIIYEAVLGTEQDRRNFQKRMRDLELIERLDEQRTGGRHRPVHLYRWLGTKSGN